MIIGVSTSFSDLDRKIAALEGVSHVEINYADLIDKTPVELALMKDKLDDAGISVWSVHSPFGTYQEISESDERLRFKALAMQKNLIPLARIIGARVIVIHPGGRIPKENRALHEEKLLLSLRELVEAAEQTGVRYGLENLPPGCMGDEPDVLLQYIREIDSPHLGITFDTGHAYLNGGFQECFELLKEDIISFHIHDNDGRRDLHLEPGYGSLDWEKFNQTFRSIEVNFPMIIECEPWGDRSYSNMTKGFEERVGNYQP